MFTPMPNRPTPRRLRREAIEAASLIEDRIAELRRRTPADPTLTQALDELSAHVVTIQTALSSWRKADLAAAKEE